MATTKSTIDYLIDQLSSSNVRARTMFGEYALYCQDKVVALVCDDELFVKITDAGKKFIGKHYEEGFAYPGAKASMHISGDLCEDAKLISELILITAKALPESKPKKKLKNI